MDINSRQRKPSKDGWAMEKVLGSGSFGTVTLYENKVYPDFYVIAVN